MRFGNVFRGQDVINVTCSVTFFRRSVVCCPFAVDNELRGETSAFGRMEAISVAEVKSDGGSRI